MNRKHAENILDAYVRMRESEISASDGEASDSLREVILDAMTSTSHCPIRVQDAVPYPVPIPNAKPTNDPYRPIVTYSAEGM